MSWSDLSTKLKQNVVGRLDLMSRHALRCTCRLNRFIVNDMDFFVPRVRVSVKDSAILIMIHTGIEKFLRIEMWIGPHRKTIIRKSQNSYDARESIEKVLPLIPRIYAARILCSLLSHKKLLIGTMEWEIDRGLDVENTKFSRKSEVFRANKLATTDRSTSVGYVLKDMFVLSDLKKVEQISVSLSRNSLTPLFSADTFANVGGVVFSTENNTYKYIHWLLEKFACLCFISYAGIGVLRFAKFDDVAREIWDGVNEPVSMITDKLKMKMESAKSVNGDLTLFHMRSSCGYWIYMVLDSRRKDFDAYNILNNSCGLGWLCKRCADPFEYDYHQNLGRRCVWEPEWNNIASSALKRTSPEWKRMIERVTKRYAINESKKKWKSSGDVTRIQKMWGFKEGSKKMLDDNYKKLDEDKQLSESDESDPEKSYFLNDYRIDALITLKKRRQGFRTRKSDEGKKDSEDLATPEGKQDSEDSKDLATPDSDEFTTEYQFQELAICITSFAFLSCAFYAFLLKFT
ncbi:hypothetical protein GCK72_021724 [Caenorhabditis remanei]|uniref:F-box domain-containing protein n=1 Tax=Caenorhabditis remanei TaxID=31234 RepID=A0A6A5GKU7_CAERE|nr:hypothetical protein GCK72_021724 [Caenorhabditis remanei]KAF1755155.1 hypothetical protein GCK72_021724 [Caenorhabditis remanei]